LGAVPVTDVVGNVFVEGVEPERKPFPTIEPEVCVPWPPSIAWSSSQVARPRAYPLRTRIGLVALPCCP